MKRITRSIISLLLSLIMLLTLVPVDVRAEGEETPKDVYTLMRERFVDMAIGGDYDAADDTYAPMLKSINDTAADYWERMNKSPVSNAVKGSYRDSDDKLMEGRDATQDHIWSEYPLGRRSPSNDTYMNANSIHFTFQYLRAMALAYQTQGCELYQNAEMLADIKSAVAFMYENHFNTTIPRYGNWFSWQIGGPLYFGEMLMLLYDDFSAEEIQNYGTALIHYLGTEKMTGANATWTERVRMYAGILLKDPKWLNLVKSGVPPLLAYNNTPKTMADGYYPDGTFIQHEYFPYNGGYGLQCISDTAYLLYMLKGTEWELPAGSDEIVRQWILDSYEPFVYNGLAMDAFRGREITRPDTTQPRGGLLIANAMLMLIDNAPAETAAQFKGIIKQWFSNDYMIQELNYSADTPWFKFPMDTVVKVNALLRDDSVKPINLSGNLYQMPVGARTIHWANNFTYTISMASKRIKTFELGDSNKKGWYTGHGMTYLYNNDLSRYDGLQKATIDWLRLPGATSVYNDKPATAYNGKSFVGGAALDNQYGVSGMDLDISNLQAKKSWFLFDDEVVALGSDISSTGKKGNAETTLENYMLAENNRSYSVNGRPKNISLNGSEVQYDDVQTFHMQGNTAGSDIGFYFPKKVSLNTKGETRQGTWNDLGQYNTDHTTQQANYFTVWQNHGQNPTSGEYAYVLLPGMNDTQTSAYANNSDIEILQQDSTAHVVEEKNLGIVAGNFWTSGLSSIDAKGVSNYLSVKGAASVVVGEEGDDISVAVADSTQENTGIVDVEINRTAKSVIGLDDGIEVVQMKPTIKLKVNVNNSTGKTFSAKFSYEEVAAQPTEITNLAMKDEALVMTLKKSPSAERYEIKYGINSGEYNKKLFSESTTANIYGLTPGETYYFVAAACHGETVSEYCAEKSFVVPSTTTFVDDLGDFTKMLSYSSGWVNDSGDGPKFDGEVTRIKRSGSKNSDKQDFSYYLPGLQDFKLQTYGYNKSLGDIKMYTSVDGDTWIPQEFKTEGVIPTTVEWYRELLTPKTSVNADANYLKIELLSHPNKPWAPQFTKFEATLTNSSDNKTAVDPMLNDSRMFEATGVKFIEGDGTAWSGDKDLVVADVEENQLVYSWTDIRKLSAVYYAKDEADKLEFYTSADGETYEPLTVSSSADSQDSQGFARTTATADILPAGTNYLKIVLGGKAALGNVSLSYCPGNEPIDRVRFADESLEGVVTYNQTPIIKTAPMNGTGSLQYSSVNKKIATYTNGVLTPAAVGTTELSVTSPTGKKATVPVTVLRNEALKKAVTASSSAATYAADKAVDGDMLVSRWQSSSNDDEWFTVDLGRSTAFDALDIKWYSNGADYDLLISDDGTVWTPLHSVTGAASGEYLRLDFEEAQTARYVKMEGITPSQYSFFEFRVLSGAELPPQAKLVNIAPTGVATASGVDPNDKSLTAAKAIDGNETSRWASARQADQWITVDLGQTAQLEAFNILWEAAYGKKYKIQVSDNNQNWTDVVEENNGAAGWKYHNLSEPVSGQYVRMLGIERGNATYGYSIYEFQIMSYESIEPMEVESLYFDKPTLRLLPGQEQTLKVTSQPQVNAASIEWSSDQPSLVAVDNQGNIQVLGEAGSAIITASSVLNPDIKASCTVEISPYGGEPKLATEVKFTDKPAATIEAGDTYPCAAVVLPDNATDKSIRFSSSDTSVAQISSSGVLRGMAAGTATIKATNLASGQFDSFDIEVTAAERAVHLPELAGVTVTASKTQAKVGEYITLTVDVTDEDKELDSIAINPGIQLDDMGNNTYLFCMPKEEVTVDVTLRDRPSFLINVNQPVGATVTADKTEAMAGKTVTVTVDVTDDQQEVAAVTTTPEVYVAAGENNTYSFEMPAEPIEVNVTLKAKSLNPKYNISLPTEAGVTVSASKLTAEKDETVNLKVTITDKSMELDTITTNPELTLTEGEAGMYSFTMPEEDVATSVTLKKIPKPITGLTLDVTELPLKEGETGTITATILPADTTDTDVVTWSSSDEAVATVEDGVVTAGQAGTAIIFAEVKTFKVSCAVTVTAVPRPLEGISLSATNLSLEPGQERELQIIPHPLDTTDVITGEWSSSNEAAATVTSAGKVTAKAPGKATITAKVGDHTATCEVTVNESRAVTGVTLDKTQLTLSTGDSATILPTVLPANALNKAVSFTSADTSVATVDARGVITAKKIGSTVITVTTNDGGKTATCKVTVQRRVIGVTGVKLDKTQLNINIGGSAILKATILPSNADNKAVSWTSSNNSVASVNASGKITAKKAGSAIITVKTKDGGKVATCKVTVKKVKVTKVVANMQQKVLKKGKTVQLKVTITPANATDKKVTWKSSNPKVASVSKTGKVKALKDGKTTITAKVDGKTAKIQIRVGKSLKAVTSVKLSKSKLKLKVKKSATLKVTVKPSNATVKKVVWTSSNSKVAKVNSKGKVTAKAKGKAIIYAKSVDGNKVAKCTVTVK